MPISQPSTRTRTRFPFLSALATRKQVFPIGLLSMFGRLLFALLTATQEKNCCGCYEYTRASGLGRDWPECAVDAEEENVKKKERNSPFGNVMGILLLCNWRTFMDACFNINSNPSTHSNSRLSRLMRNAYCSAASLA